MVDALGHWESADFWSAQHSSNILISKKIVYCGCIRLFEIACGLEDVDTITDARTIERFLDGQSWPDHTLCRPRSSRRSRPSTRLHGNDTSQAYQDPYHS